jgi:hypothetical protein
MAPNEYCSCFHEAMAKAFGARSPATRLAYLDLADFYRARLNGRVQLQPSPEILASCLAARRASN